MVNILIIARYGNQYCPIWQFQTETLCYIAVYVTLKRFGTIFYN